MSQFKKINNKQVKKLFNKVTNPQVMGKKINGIVDKGVSISQAFQNDAINASNNITNSAKDLGNNIINNARDHAHNKAHQLNDKIEHKFNKFGNKLEKGIGKGLNTLNKISNTAGNITQVASSFAPIV